jgi:hypothetical protein
MLAMKSVSASVRRDDSSGKARGEKGLSLGAPHRVTIEKTRDARGSAIDRQRARVRRCPFGFLRREEQKMTASRAKVSCLPSLLAALCVVASLALGVSAEGGGGASSAVTIATSALNMTVHGDAAVDPTARAHFCSRDGEPVTGVVAIALGDAGLEGSIFESGFNGTRWCVDDGLALRHTVYQLTVPMERFEHRMCGQVVVALRNVSMTLTGKLPKGLERAAAAPLASDLDWQGNFR